MSVYANNRRKATSHIGTASVTPNSATTGVDERKKLYGGLSEYDKKILRLFETDDGRTEMDVYTVFVCRVNEKHGRLAIETDTPPSLIVERISGLDKAGHSNFILPVHALHDKVWCGTFPKFEKWCISGTRYPSLGADNKTLIPGLSGSYIKNIYDFDIMETYLSALVGTLGEYLVTGDGKYAKNIWMLLRTINYLNNYETSFISKDKRDALKKCILERDQSEQCATNYKKMISSLKPNDYYSMMSTLMIETPELVHKSSLTHLDTFLLGLMLQKNSIGQMQQIEENVLRMILERAMKRVPKLTLTEFIDKDKLVEHLHMYAGTGVESALKYWSFMVETTRILTCRNYSLNELTDNLITMRDTTKSLKGLLPACLFICPTAEGFLSEENLAEFILVSSVADRKFTILNSSMFNEKIKTPEIDKLINENIERAKKTQDMTVIEAVKEKISNTPYDIWTEFLEHVGCVNHPNLVHSGKSHIFKQWLMKLAKAGEKENINLLKSLIDGAKEVDPPVLGEKRSRSLVMRCAGRGSDVYAHFAGFYTDDKNLPCGGVSKKGIEGKIYKDLHFDLTSVKKIEITADDKPIEFIKFEVAREIVSKLKSYKIKTECPICFREVKKFAVLHKDERHVVCCDCRDKLNVCPFCRKINAP